MVPRRRIPSPGTPGSRPLENADPWKNLQRLISASEQLRAAEEPSEKRSEKLPFSELGPPSGKTE